MEKKKCLVLFYDRRADIQLGCAEVGQTSKLDAACVCFLKKGDEEEEDLLREEGGRQGGGKEKNSVYVRLGGRLYSVRDSF